MLNFISKSFKDIKREKQNQLYRDGYSWALGQYFSGTMCILEIKSCLSNFDRNAFDRGVSDAVHIVTQLRLTKENELFNLHKAYAN